MNKTNNQQPPSKITYDNKVITSPRSIANISNNYFIQKVEKIRNIFTQSKFYPIKILNKLIPPINNNMIFPLITNEKTLKLIDRLSSTNSKSYDNVTN